MWLACAPAGDPEAPVTCKECEEQGAENFICELDIQNQAQDQQVVTCIGANASGAERSAHCNEICAAWHLDHFNPCVAYSVEGSFVCQGTPPVTDGPDGGWEPNDYVDYDSENGVYIVDQQLVDALNDGASILNNDATYLKELTSGGFEFNNVTTGSLAWELGFQNGDIPHTVNGYDVTTTDGVFIALAALRTATSLTVKVKRGAHFVFLYYSIQ